MPSRDVRSGPKTVEKNGVSERRHASRSSLRSGVEMADSGIGARPGNPQIEPEARRTVK